MKICFVVGTLERGGAEKQLVFMLRALQKMGIAAEVLCLTEGESYEYEIKNAGFNVKWVGMSKNRMSRLWKIIRELRESRADIVQSSHFYTNLYAAAAGRYLGVRSIGAVRNDLISEIKSHQFTGRWQVSLPDVLIANSDAARCRLLERRVNPKRIEFVHNVVETEKEIVDPSARQGLKILFVGRLDESKRPERFVRLASILTEQFPHLGLEFQVAGDGKQRRALEDMAQRLNLLPHKLKFFGGSFQMSEIYRGADILVSTSDCEGTPNVVLEAMAHGLPVVATMVGGTKEVLDATRGILVKPGDEAALVNAATELVLNKDLRIRLGAEGRRFVRDNHSFENLQQQLSEVYERLLCTV